jgi:hypothetical protein
MADVYHAYSVLNETLNLGLSEEQLNKAEMAYKENFSRQEGFAIPRDDLSDWELFVYLKPRKDSGK